MVIVAFVAQLGEPGSCWAPVIEHLPPGIDVVTYDRPGLGNCPPRPRAGRRVPFSVFADELSVALDDQGVTEPAVVVGHSMGSLIARMFAARYPERTAGIVSVDGSIPRMRFGPGFEPLGIQDPVDGDHPDATPIDIVNGEIEVVEAELPDVPAAVLMRSSGTWDGWPEAVERLWLAYQRQLARQLRAPLVVADKAGHQIPDDAPRLVAHVVSAVVNAARFGGPCRIDAHALRSVGGSLAPL